MIRRTASAVAAVAMLLVLAAPVLAGGWADIVADAQTGTPPVEGQPITIGFKVMQHGVTPAPWETATVHLTDSATGDTLDAPSKNDDPNGHFTATVTLPHAGYWAWTVTLQNLAAQGEPVTVAVRTKAGAMPPFDPATALTAIDRAKSEVRAELSNTFGAELERLDGSAEGMRSRLSHLEGQVTALGKQRDALQERVSSLESGGGSVPILGIVTLAVLAGAAAGFGMSWLAGRPAVRERATLSPAPRGADAA